jgi:hypothetical protein
MLVLVRMCSRNAWQSVKVVLTATWCDGGGGEEQQQQQDGHDGCQGVQWWTPLLASEHTFDELQYHSRFTRLQHGPLHRLQLAT